MATFTETWNAAFEQSPADTDNASEGAGKIRGTRIAVQERFEIDHSHAGDADDGKHKKLTLITQGGDPTLDAGNSAIYSKTTTGLTDIFFKTPQGNVIWLSPRPGTVELTARPTAQPEWIKLNDGSIGSAASGGTTRANADCERLFTLLWDNTTNTECQVQDSAGTPVARGGSAAADWSANRRIVTPIALGRALTVAGSGAGLTARALAARVGAETHQLATSEIPSHTHTVNDTGHIHREKTLEDLEAFKNTGGGGADSNPSIQSTGTGSATIVQNTGATLSGVSINNAGGDGAHNNMQPSVFLNVMMKL